MPIYKVKEPIMHNGKLLKEGDLIEITEKTADNFEKVNTIVSPKYWARIREGKKLIPVLKIKGKLKKIKFKEGKNERQISS